MIHHAVPSRVHRWFHLFTAVAAPAFHGQLAHAGIAANSAAGAVSPLVLTNGAPTKFFQACNP
jgi:hypothetical protein